MGGVQSPVLQAWLPADIQAVDWGAHPPMASGVGIQATDRVCAPTRGFAPMRPGSLDLDLGAHPTWVSGVCWGCLSGVHTPGAEGVGAQEATAAAENSLNSH